MGKHYSHTDEARKRISDSRRGVPRPDEARARISEGRRRYEARVREAMSLLDAVAEAGGPVVVALVDGAPRVLPIAREMAG